MSRIDACGGCGTELSPGARYCVKCGRTQAPPLLDLERLQAPSSPEPAVERTVVEQGGPRVIRRGVAALAAIAVLSVAAVLVLAGGGTDDRNDRSEPTTTSEPDRTTRPRPSTTTVDGSSRRFPRRRARRGHPTATGCSPVTRGATSSRSRRGMAAGSSSTCPRSPAVARRTSCSPWGRTCPCASRCRPVPLLSWLGPKASRPWASC
jgi:hypothetical protein